MKRGPYEITSTKEVYRNGWLSVHEDHLIKSDSQIGMYGVIEYGHGVGTIAFDNEHNIFLVKEYCYAVDDYIVTLPSGGIDGDETPETAAKRELLEEAGVTADEWTLLGKTIPLPMVINSVSYLFLAEHAHITAGHEKEFELLRIPFDKAYEMVMKNEIFHSGTCVAILKAKAYLSK